jgi:hypothetical protein
MITNGVVNVQGYASPTVKEGVSEPGAVAIGSKAALNEMESSYILSVWSIRSLPLPVLTRALPYGRASDTIRARQFQHQFGGAL